MGDQCLLAAAQRAAVARRRSRRPLWPTAAANRRSRPVRAGIPGLRRRPQPDLAAGGALRPGSRRSDADAQQPGNPRPDLFRRGQRPRDRHLGGVGRGRRRARPGAGRLADRHRQLALRVPDQRAAGARGHGNGADRRPCRPRRQRRPARRPRRDAGHRRAVPHHLGADRRLQPRLVGLGAGRARGRRGAADAVRDRRKAAGRARDDAGGTVRFGQLRRADAADLSPLWRARRLVRAGALSADRSRRLQRDAGRRGPAAAAAGDLAGLAGSRRAGGTDRAATAADDRAGHRRSGIPAGAAHRRRRQLFHRRAAGDGGDRAWHGGALWRR